MRNIVNVMEVRFGTIPMAAAAAIVILTAVCAVMAIYRFTRRPHGNAAPDLSYRREAILYTKKAEDAGRKKLQNGGYVKSCSKLNNTNANNQPKKRKEKNKPRNISYEKYEKLKEDCEGVTDKYKKLAEKYRKLKNEKKEREELLKLVWVWMEQTRSLEENCSKAVNWMSIQRMLADYHFRRDDCEEERCKMHDSLYRALCTPLTVCTVEDAGNALINIDIKRRLHAPQWRQLAVCLLKATEEYGTPGEQEKALEDALEQNGCRPLYYEDADEEQQHYFVDITSGGSYPAILMLYENEWNVIEVGGHRL